MAMWRTKTELLVPGRVQRTMIHEGDEPLRYAGVLDRWVHDEAFRLYFIGLLTVAPFPAYFWETPPISRSMASRVFEHVLVNSPALAAVTAEGGAFARRFASAGADALVTRFSNLGGDACLIAPCPRVSRLAYPHLAAFARHAPLTQQHALWEAVGRAAGERLSLAPLWISTSGLGVSWLHVRLDSVPKYYTYVPYRRPD